MHGIGEYSDGCILGKESGYKPVALFNKSGTVHKKHKKDHKKAQKRVLFGRLLCLLCTVPDLLGKAEPVRK